MHFANLAKILALTLALAGGSAWLRAARPQSGLDAPMGSVPATTIPLLRVGEAENLWREGGTLFLDVRSEIDFDYGHIAGAVAMPYEEWDERFEKLKPRLERARALVVYCKSLDCGKSLWAAQRLWNAGLKQTRIYPGGWNEWSLRGLPTHATGTR